VGELTRRGFLGRAAAAAVLIELRGFVTAKGAWPPAEAQSPDLVRETLDALVAFMIPGDDAYSVAQGDSRDGPGGVAGGGGGVLMDRLDFFVPQPDNLAHNDDTVPLSAAIAAALNLVALTVNPAAAGGAFISPFARLSLEEKIEVFRVLETSTEPIPADQLPEPFTNAPGTIEFTATILPGFVSFMTMSESGAFDPATRTLTQRPVGWELTQFQPDGPVEGWDEFIGYFEGRTRAT